MAASKPKEAAPHDELAALERALAGGALPRAFVVRGEERWYRERALERIVAASRAGELELARHDPQDPDFALGSLCDDLAAPPMFAGARAVVVRNAHTLLKKEGTSESAFLRAAQTFLGDAKRAGVLVVEAESLRIDSVLAKSVVAAGGRVSTFRRLWDTAPAWDPDPRKTELVQWLRARARERKIALEPDEALYVAAAVGNDLHALDSALDRVANKGREGVRGLVAWTSGASPFEVAENLCRGDGARAVAGVAALFRSGFQEKDGSREADLGAVIAVFSGALRSKLRQTLAGALVLDRGGDVAAAAEAAGVTNPRAKVEFEARLRARPAAEWKRMLASLAELERRSRSGATVDVNDYVAFAAKWGKPVPRPAAPGARR